MPKIVDHEARRAEITGVAVRLIAEGGLELATIREIAAHSGFSKGVVEHYFDNKEELISAALDLVNEDYRERAERAAASRRGLAAIRALLLITLPTTAALRREWRVRLVFWSMATTDRGLRRRQGQRFRRAAEQFARHFAEAAQAREISLQGTPEEAGRRLVNTVSGLSIAALHSSEFGGRAFLEREVEHLINALSTGAWRL